MKGQYSSEVSDVDLLFIVTDDCPSETVKELEDNLINLEIKYEFPKFARHNQLLHIFALRTALFKSHFILRLRSIRKMDLYALFKEGKGFDFPFCRLLFPLAPAKLVIQNVLLGRRILYGKDTIEEDLLSPTLLDFHKSFILSFAISIFGVMTSFFSRIGTFFSLEAVKWHVLNSHSLLENKVTDLKSAIQYIIAKDSLFSPLIMSNFLKLRKKYSRDLFFSFLTPLYLLYIHFILFSKRTPELYETRPHRECARTFRDPRRT